MASRMSLTRLSAPLAKRALSTTAPASLSATAVASSSAAKLTGRNALLSTPVARVHRGESRFLVGQEQRRMASSEEGGSTMVCLLNVLTDRRYRVVSGVRRFGVSIDKEWVRDGMLELA